MWMMLDQGLLGILVIVVGYLSLVLLYKNKKDSCFQKGNVKTLMLQLIQRKQVSDDSIILTFSLPNKSQKLGVPTGQHIKLIQELKSKDFPQGEQVERKYTPITHPSTTGVMELLVKVYRPNEHPLYPQGGKLSMYLDNMKQGDSIKVQGPIGRFTYIQPGTINIQLPSLPSITNKVTRINMIAGGSGVTPMYQVIMAIADNNHDHTQLSFLFANKKENDILLRDELERYQKEKGLQLHLTLDSPPEGWTGLKGLITKDMLQQSMFAARDDTLTLLCGPPPMLKLVAGLLMELGHKEHNIFSNKLMRTVKLSIQKQEKLCQLTESMFLDECNKMLEKLEQKVQELEDDYDLESNLQDGVLTVQCPFQRTFIINRQIPNQQIWYSSPVTGPARFTFYQQQWINQHHQELYTLFFQELKLVL